MKQKEKERTLELSLGEGRFGSGTFRDMRDQEVNAKVKIQTQLNGGGVVVNEQITRKQSHL